MRDPLHGTRPLWIVVISGIVGAVVARSLVPGVGWTSLWRLVVLPVALTFVVVGLMSLVRLGRLERQRARPSRGEYLRAASAFAVAFGLLVAAGS